MNVVALKALKRVEVETHACGHDASEHHVSMTLGASGAMDVSVNVFGPGTKFCHELPSKRRDGSATLSVTANLPVEERGDKDNRGA